jgi:hypothetical protein
MHYIAIGVLVVLLMIWGAMALLAWGKFNLSPRDPEREQATEREGRE